MAMERKTIRVTTLSSAFWVQGSPVVLEDAGIFKDIQNAERSLFLILKFKNIGNALSGIDIDINCLDSFGDQVGDIKNYKYVDLNISTGKTFGGYTHIPLPDNTSTYHVSLNRVLFSDGNTCDFKQRAFEPVEKQENMKDVLGEVYQQYLRERGWGNKKDSIYYPQELGSYWRCNCGSINLTESKCCATCGQAKNVVFEVCTPEYQNKLKINLAKYKAEREKAKLEAQRQLEIERQEEKERQEQKKLMEAARQKQRIRRIKTTSYCLVAVAIISILCFILKTPVGYYVALKSFDNSKYNSAAVMFEKLGEYKNSKELWHESTYQLGLEAYSNKNYIEAISIFARLGDYKDSDGQWRESVYQQGLKAYENQQYADAIEFFNRITEYKDSQEQIEKTIYQQIDTYLKENTAESYSKAVIFLQGLEKIPNNIQESKLYEGLNFLFEIQGEWYISRWTDESRLHMGEELLSIKGTTVNVNPFVWQTKNGGEIEVTTFEATNEKPSVTIQMNTPSFGECIFVHTKSKSYIQTKVGTFEVYKK